MFKRTVDRSLTAQLLQHLGGTGQSVTRFTDRDVQDELLDAKLPVGVLGLLRLRKKQWLVKCPYRLNIDISFKHTMLAVVVSMGRGWREM